MSFRSIKQDLVTALEQGRYEHEARDALAEKNLLAIGDVDAGFVVRLLHRTRGDQYRHMPHHWDETVTVHVFAPELDGRRWYVKAYFLDEEMEHAVVMSVHRSGDDANTE